MQYTQQRPATASGTFKIGGDLQVYRLGCQISFKGFVGRFMSKGSDRLCHTQVLLRDESCRFGDRDRLLATPVRVAELTSSWLI